MKIIKFNNLNNNLSHKNYLLESLLSIGLLSIMLLSLSDLTCKPRFYINI